MFVLRLKTIEFSLNSILLICLIRQTYISCIQNYPVLNKAHLPISINAMPQYLRKRQILLGTFWLVEGTPVIGRGIGVLYSGKLPCITIIIRSLRLNDTYKWKWNARPQFSKVSMLSYLNVTHASVFKCRKTNMPGCWLLLIIEISTSILITKLLPLLNIGRWWC